MGHAATTRSGAEHGFLQDIQLGLGAWAWGDRVVWEFGRGYGTAEVREAFATSMAEGIRFIDTAEVYGSGRSERFIGEFASSTETSPLVATKFFPWPWRLSRKAIPRALRASLKRLSMQDLYLYQVHSPNSLLSPEAMAEGLVECMEAGLTRCVGVSNFDEGQMLRVYTTMARHSVFLASNQLHYSLLHRQAEKNGLLARCKELGITLVAYSPLEMGLLTGKYGRSHLPPGSRALRYASVVGRLQPLLKRMTEIGQDQGGKSNAQIALNWVIAKGALPIPGAKNGRQAAENAGARGWSLTPDEVASLDEVSDAVAAGRMT
ncbi:MAG TPA: aldo/keto reductase [Anaerolineales bacterium]